MAERGPVRPTLKCIERKRGRESQDVRQRVKRGGGGELSEDSEEAKRTGEGPEEQASDSELHILCF